MIMYRVKETMFSGIALQEKEVLKVTNKTITYLDSHECEVMEHKENRSAKWFEDFSEAKRFAVRQLELQIKEHSKRLNKSQARLKEIKALGEDK